MDGAAVWTDATSPYAHNWLAGPGSHRVKAKAFDSCSNERFSQELTFDVSDPDPCAADGTAPQVTVTLPASGEVTTPSSTGRVLFRASASDASGGRPGGVLG